MSITPGKGQKTSFNSTTIICESTQSTQTYRRLGKAQQLSIFQRFTPLYAAQPYWSLESVPHDESLPGQRYRLTLTHGNLKRAVPLQLLTDEGDRLFDAVRELACDWALDLDRSGQLCSCAALEALTELVRALVGGEDNA